MPNAAYWKLMDPEEEKIGTKRAQDALAQGKDIQLELRIYPPGGNTRWLAIRGRPNHDGSDASSASATTSPNERNRKGRFANPRNGSPPSWTSFRAASACSTRMASPSCVEDRLLPYGAKRFPRRTRTHAGNGNPSMQADDPFRSINIPALKH